MTDFLIEIFRELADYLMATFRDWGWDPDTAKLFNNIINFILIGCVSALSWVIAKFIIIILRICIISTHASVIAIIAFTLRRLATFGAQF